MGAYEEKIKMLKKEVMKEAEFFCSQLGCLDETFPISLHHKIKNKNKGFAITIDAYDFCESKEMDVPIPPPTADISA
jgi:hypothetical protein